MAARTGKDGKLKAFLTATLKGYLTTQKEGTQKRSTQTKRDPTIFGSNESHAKVQPGRDAVPKTGRDYIKTAAQHTRFQSLTGLTESSADNVERNWKGKAKGGILPCQDERRRRTFQTVRKSMEPTPPKLGHTWPGYQQGNGAGSGPSAVHGCGSKN